MLKVFQLIKKYLLLSGVVCALIACSTGKRPLNYGLSAQNNGPSYCSDNFCLIVGSYKTNNSNIGAQPLVLRSTDHGKTFQSISSIPVPNQSFASALVGLSCSENVCVAVGISVQFVNMTLEILPYAIRSSDFGATFELVTDLIVPADAEPPESSNNFNTLLNISCHNQNCTAIGVYVNENGVQLPYAIQSTDFGQTFSTVSQVNIPNFVPDLTNQTAFATGISCEFSMCIISGIYTTSSDGMSKPFALRSNDGGRHFSENIPISLPSSFLSSETTPTVMIGVECGNGNCIGVGSYANSSDGQTMYADINPSEDNAFDIQSLINFPSNFNPGGFSSSLVSLYSVACRSTECLAAGSYTNFQNGANLQMFKSQNGGLTFDSVSNLPIPSDIDSTTYTNALANISCANKNCVTIGSYASTSNVGLFPYIAYSKNFGKTFQNSMFQLPEDALIGANETICFGIELLNFNCLF